MLVQPITSTMLCHPVRQHWAQGTLTWIPSFEDANRPIKTLRSVSPRTSGASWVFSYTVCAFGDEEIISASLFEQPSILFLGLVAVDLYSKMHRLYSVRAVVLENTNRDLPACFNVSSCGCRTLH